MATCKECYHTEVCARHNRMVQIDEHTWDEFEQLADVEKFCNHFKPTADVVEVVRCKDCKYWQDNNGGYPNEECRWGKDETPDENDFCSYGERKEQK